MAPEHVIQSAVRAAEAEVVPGAARISNEKAAVGVWPVLAPDAGFDADGELQATASKTSDAIAAVRFIGITCCNGRAWFRLLAAAGARPIVKANGAPIHHLGKEDPLGAEFADVTVEP